MLGKGFMENILNEECEDSRNPLFNGFADDWFFPCWRRMDGGVMRVYAIDVEMSLKTGKVLLLDAY